MSPYPVLPNTDTRRCSKLGASFQAQPENDAGFCMQMWREVWCSGDTGEHEGSRRCLDPRCLGEGIRGTVWDNKSFWLCRYKGAGALACFGFPNVEKTDMRKKQEKAKPPGRKLYPRKSPYFPWEFL